MPTTACTSYYTTRITGYVAASGNTVGSIVTFGTPTPVASDVTGGTIYQCSAVTLGGFNGLNN
jgi:hypothetical protein